ncbi:hypothetical protein DEF23_20915 [Marinitenerispora sediminis]|uniref:Uncharacterized protein n=1 Tax=Marinitenerispora sediminis TaxID=1931232 RepID=A0A368T9S4_9ACTN|nr:hypothetical protein DEF23_20915 [Marinitenerispora sediminis]RCV59331.1 hypothetical protein DEF24_10185 [Marinitenerispora sediminis]
MTTTSRWSAPCRHWIGAESRWCGATPTRLYIQGPRCQQHTPARLAGHPEPGRTAGRRPAHA